MITAHAIFETFFATAFIDILVCLSVVGEGLVLGAGAGPAPPAAAGRQRHPAGGGARLHHLAPARLGPVQDH